MFARTSILTADPKINSTSRVNTLRNQVDSNTLFTSILREFWNFVAEVAIAVEINGPPSKKGEKSYVTLCK